MIKWSRSKSFKNCHVLGVDSLVAEEGKLRMFVARPWHELWKDHAVAVHSHHRDIGIKVVYGVLTNYLFASHYAGVHYNQYKHDSAITGGGSGFTEFGSPRPLLCCSWVELRPGREMFQGADVLHTVEVKQARTAAWLITEGREDYDYDAVCYSIRDLTKWSPDGLYQEMDEQYFNTLLQEVEAATAAVGSRS